jgi:hypothetical protein
VEKDPLHMTLAATITTKPPCPCVKEESQFTTKKRKESPPFH